MGPYEFQEEPTPATGIAAQPAAGSAMCPGSLVTAFVSASGTGPFTYQWYKDNGNSPVSNQTSATLTLTNVQTSDAGSYSVVVTGFFNAVTSAAFSLSVNTPLSTLSSATLTCAQTSVTLTAGGGTSYALSDGQTNETGQFVVNSPGTYTVTVSNANGCTATASVSVTVNTPPAAPTLTGVSRTVDQSNTPLPLGQFVNAIGSNVLSFSGVNGPIANPPTAGTLGTQRFSVSQTEGTGCVSPVTPFTITGQESNTTTTPVNQTLCRSSRVVLTATTTGVRYEW